MILISDMPICFQLDAEYDVLLGTKQHKNEIRDDDDKDNVDVDFGESEDAVDDKADADDAAVDKVEAYIQVERGIRIQEEVDDYTGSVYNVDNNDSAHVK